MTVPAMTRCFACSLSGVAMGQITIGIAANDPSLPGGSPPDTTAFATQLFPVAANGPTVLSATGFLLERVDEDLILFPGDFGSTPFADATVGSTSLANYELGAGPLASLLLERPGIIMSTGDVGDYASSAGVDSSPDNTTAFTGLSVEALLGDQEQALVRGAVGLLPPSLLPTCIGQFCEDEEAYFLQLQDLAIVDIEVSVPEQRMMRIEFTIATEEYDEFLDPQDLFFPDFFAIVVNAEAIDPDLLIPAPVEDGTAIALSGPSELAAAGLDSSEDVDTEHDGYLFSVGGAQTFFDYLLPPGNTRLTFIIADHGDNNVDTSAFIERPIVGCNAVDLAQPLGIINSSDVNTFVDAFLNQLPAADLAAPFGIWNSSDVNAFVAQFLAGCPGDAGSPPQLNPGDLDPMLAAALSSLDIQLDENPQSPCNTADLAAPFGQLDALDLVTFLNATISAPSANIAADTTAFMNAFSEGCP